MPMTEKPNEKPKLELVETPAPDSIFDDLDGLRKASEIKVKRKVLTVNVAVGKPKNNIYFRCHPTISFDKGLVIVGPEGSDDFYYVAPSMKDHPNIAPRIREVVIAVVYTWPSGVISLWPVVKAGEDCRVACWKTAFAAYEQSKTDWMQLVWNDDKRDYDATPAENLSIEPLWPHDLNFKNLLKLGFANKIIADQEHPYVRQLRGFSD
jgi:hypothetical protein